MKRILLGGLFLLLLLAPFLVSAEDACTVKFPVTRDVPVERLIYNGAVLEQPLEIRNIRHVNQTSPCWVSFDVYNKAPVPIKATIRYSTAVTVGTNTTVIERVFRGAIVPPQGYKRLNEYAEQASSCLLLEDAFTIIYESTQNATLQTVKEKVTTEECVLCTSQECTSNLCHNNYCVQSCPEGTGACNGLCMPIATTQVGEPYSCDFQCTTRLGNGDNCVECLSNDNCAKGICNLETGKCGDYYNGTFACEEGSVPCDKSNTCVLRGTKGYREAYLCEEECSSGKGNKNGVCTTSNLTNAFMVLGFVLGIVVAAIIVNLWRKKNRLAKTNEQLEGTVRKKEVELNKVQADIDTRVANKTKIVREQYQTETKRLKEEHHKEKSSLEKELEEMNSEVQSAKHIRAVAVAEKVAAQREAKEAKEQLAEEQKEIASQQIIIARQKKELETERAEREREQAELEEVKKKYWDACLTPYPSPHASNRPVIKNPLLKGYECFYKEGRPLEKYTWDDCVHRWVWQHHNGRKPRPGYHIHHKDHNKYNNAIENLEEVEGTEHFKEHSTKFHRNE